jgi:hypothetical protein
MEASRSQGDAVTRGRFWRSAVFALTMVAAACAAELAACGGSTGREGLSTPDSGGDVTLDDGGLDVSIQYVDRLLPDLYVAPFEASSVEGGGPANCAPDLPVIEQLDDAGRVASFTINEDGSVPTAADQLPGEVPAVWLDDGGEALALDGGACATQVWLGSAACDECVRTQCGGTPGNGPWYGEYGNAAMLPPCSDMAEAGLAVAGPGASQARLGLCQQALQCIVASQCFTDGTDGCYCGKDCITAGPNGVCGAAIQAALEVQGTTPSDTIHKVAQLFGGSILPPDGVGHGGASLGVIVSCIISNCVQACTRDGG